MPLKMQETPKKEDQNDKEEAFYEDLDFTKPNFEFIPKGEHEFMQRGPYLICRACDLEHAVWIGMEKIMIGTDKKGKPILRARA